MLIEEMIGYIAATFTTGCFIPQVVKTLRTKDTSSISLSMYAMFCTGVAFWLVYGILLEKPPIIASNIITLVLAVTVLVMKIRHK